MTSYCCSRNWFCTVPNKVYSIDKDISAYPKFVPNKYQVTYNANDGVGSFLNQDVFYNDQYQVLANNFTKDNYTFVGWSTDKDAKYDANNLLKPNQEYTLFTEGLNLYAIWKGVDINVVFDDSNLTVDGNAYQLGDQVIPYGDYYTLPTFTGVAENSSDATLKFAGFVINGNVYQPGSQILVTEDLSITLNWQTANSVLNFNIQAPMGESVSNVDPMAFYIEQDSYLYEDIPTMSDLNNYNFVCWNTREDGSGQSFVAGENFETSEPFTVLYAIWQGKVREVNLYNDGELITTLTCRYGEYLDLPTYSLDKHTFIGFNSEEDNSGTTFNGRILMNFTGDVDLYAQYSRNQVTISFNANGGAGTIDNILINSEDIYTFNSDEILNQKTAITNKYYTLVGWSTNPDTNSDDASFEITTNTNNLTLYAVWARNQVQVVYTSSMDSDLPERHTIDQGGEFNFTEDGFTKDGYYVEGFKVNGETYNVGDKIECVEDENLVVDVVWKKLDLLVFKTAGQTITTVKNVSGEVVNTEDLVEGDRIYAPYIDNVEDTYYDKDGTRYYFAGWTHIQNGLTPMLFARETTIQATGDSQTFYAVYKTASEELEYKYNKQADNYTAIIGSGVKEITTDNYTLVVPNIYQGKPVVDVLTEQTDSFKTTSMRVVVAEGMTRLMTSAFRKCDAFTNIMLPNSIKNIGGEAFSRCTNLKQIILPENVMNIGDYAFSNCINLQNVIMSDNLVNIGEYAFAFCGKLQSIKLSNNITRLNEGTFDQCTSLSEVYLPEGLETIKNGNFSFCTNLKQIQLPESIRFVSGFAYSGLTSVVIPDGVIEVDNDAFSYCEDLESVTFPERIEYDWDLRFTNCISLESIVLPEGLIKLSSNIFTGCTQLKNVVIPSTVTTLETSAFWKCVELESIELPENLTTIENNVFSGCTKLRSIIIPDSVNEILNNAFKDCISLTSIELPENLTEIDRYTFSGCSNLNSVVIPNSVTTMDDTAFINCTSISEVTIPTHLAGYMGATFSCETLTKAIVTLGSTQELDNAPFSGYDNLLEVILPEGLKIIGEYA
ncbi:MAG: leucine-rich repeat protein, partial [Clostridia bacterium]|nr:leucine-rich repeat protein [Clostridia bacterium]